MVAQYYDTAVVGGGIRVTRKNYSSAADSQDPHTTRRPTGAWRPCCGRGCGSRSGWPIGPGGCCGDVHIGSMRRAEASGHRDPSHHGSFSDGRPVGPPSRRGIRGGGGERARRRSGPGGRARGGAGHRRAHGSGDVTNRRCVVPGANALTGAPVSTTDRQCRNAESRPARA